MSPTTPEISAEPRIFCKSCGYDLRACQDNRCSECGRQFDLADHKTFATHPPRERLRRWIKRGITAFVILLALLGGAWGWLYWGWREDQLTIVSLSNLGVPFTNINAAEGASPSTIFPIYSEWGEWVFRFRRLLGPAGFAMDRMQRCFLPTNLAGPQFDSIIVQFKDLKYLQVLVFDDANITDAYLLLLKELKTIKILKLDSRYSQVTDAGLLNIQQMKQLIGLSLSGKQVSDAGLIHLKELKNLRWLNLFNTKVTDAGIQDLQIALPNCNIETFYP